MACFDQRPHIAVKEGQNQGLDMGTIRIRIGHDDDFVIIGIFHIEISPYSCTDGVNHGVDFFIFHDVCHLGLGGVEDLTS